MSNFLKVEDIESILNTSVKKFKIGSLYTIEYGVVYLQAFKQGMEGILTYGILDTGYIELNNGEFNPNAYLKYNKDTKLCETKYY